MIWEGPNHKTVQEKLSVSGPNKDTVGTSDKIWPRTGEDIFSIFKVSSTVF